MRDLGPHKAESDLIVGKRRPGGEHPSSDAPRSPLKGGRTNAEKFGKVRALPYPH